MKLERVITRGDFADAARSLIGVPFHHQGRSRAGLDCAGLVVLAGKIAGLDLPDTIDYGPIPNPSILLERLQAIADQVRPCDVCFSRHTSTTHRRSGSHSRPAPRW